MGTATLLENAHARKDTMELTVNTPCVDRDAIQWEASAVHQESVCVEMGGVENTVISVYQQVDAVSYAQPSMIPDCMNNRILCCFHPNYCVHHTFIYPRFLTYSTWFQCRMTSCYSGFPVIWAQDHLEEFL